MLLLEERQASFPVRTEVPCSRVEIVNWLPLRLKWLPDGNQLVIISKYTIRLSDHYLPLRSSPYPLVTENSFKSYGALRSCVFVLRACVVPC